MLLDQINTFLSHDGLSKYRFL
ncbi:hypothetical protein VCHENC02_0616A, partial [Vibrio harveyi]